MWPGKVILAVLVSLLTLDMCASFASTKDKPVMVYYMPWYAAKPFSGEWGWHWTMNHFNPDTLNASGERQVASWYYPLIGPYDSSDPVVLEYHVLLMKLAGIDGVIVDWYGSANYLDYGANNQATARLFDFTRKAGLKFSICYEDKTIQHMIDGQYLASTNAIMQAQRDMMFLQTNYLSDPSYLRHDGKPVLLNFGPQFFTANSDWGKIFSVLAPQNKPAFFTEDNRLAEGIGAYDWPPMWLSQTPGTGGVLSDAALKNYLAGFEQKAQTWPTFISSAFPRFHDIYQRAGNRSYWGYLGDRNGETLRETLSQAMTDSSAIAQIVTWNDFGEGTAVEPTKEYGYRDLGLIQDFRRQYLDSNFSFRTNDLALALRFYNLRRQSVTNTILASELDCVFTNIVSGQEENALFQLSELEAKFLKK